MTALRVGQLSDNARVQQLKRIRDTAVELFVSIENFTVDDAFDASAEIEEKFQKRVEQAGLSMELFP